MGVSRVTPRIPSVVFARHLAHTHARSHESDLAKISQKSSLKSVFEKSDGQKISCPDHLLEHVKLTHVNNIGCAPTPSI